MKVISVFKTHVDIGFTDLPHKVLEKYSSGMLKDVIETCEATANFDKNKRFVWTMPAFVLSYALDHATDELKKRAEALIENGQIVWHALPFTIRTEFFTKFELTHALDRAKELSKRYNKPMPVCAKMTDVPGHTQALIDVLSENGIEFLHLGCNDASTHPDVPRLFRWVSKKGNSIVVYYDKDYGSSLLPPDDWDFPVHLAMTVSRDNCGVQAPEIIENQIAELGSSYEYSTGTMDDFWRELSRCDLSGLPVITGELGDTWIHSLGAFPEALVAVCPVKATFEKIYKFLEEKKDSSFESLTQKYFDNLFLFGEHSGGVSSMLYIAKNRKYNKKELLRELSGTELCYANRGWDDERRWAFTARDAALELQEEVEKKYNLSFAEKENISEKAWEIAVTDGKLTFFHKSGKSVSLSYNYNITGYDTIESFMDNYLRTKPFWAYCDFGRYYQNPDSPEEAINSYPNISDICFEAKLEKVFESDNSVTAGYHIPEKSFDEFGNFKALNITASVFGERVHITVDALEKEPTMYAEAGNLCFTINEDIQAIRINKSGVEIDPETDIVKGANSVLFAIDKYVKVNNFKFDTFHTPLVAFGENPIYRFNAAPFEMPKINSIVFNLFNNMWGTGAPQWISGSHRFEYDISII